MRITNCLIPTIVTALACWAGYETCGENHFSNRPVDETGRTSIVVEFGNGDWAELRGPARWDVLECIGEPINVVDYGDGTGEADYNGR